MKPELLPQRFSLSEGQIAVGPGLINGDCLALQQISKCVAVVRISVETFKNGYFVSLRVYLLGSCHTNQQSI